VEAAPDAGFASRTPKVEGVKLRYLAGQGLTVVLLHGYAEMSRMWRPIIPIRNYSFRFRRRRAPSPSSPGRSPPCQSPPIGGEKANGEALGEQAKLVAFDATVLGLESTGHWMMEENPKETTDALIGFLGQ
jgi:pimeloyl-ACP methyl ester carboxylesterase